MNTHLLIATWPIFLAGWSITQHNRDRDRMGAGRTKVWDRRDREKQS
jgi:hypothetical protein